VNSDTLVAELAVLASGGKDPRNLAWELNLDALAMVRQDGSTVRFLIWRESVLEDGLFFSNRPSDDEWYFCMGKKATVGLVHGQKCLIYTEV